ncbi:putative disease resistance protein At4g19050 isoform X2 [Rosa rugosa]|nr:putative disease resistance protein At4g19050 isoform X2 [Rosa rugosa]XP_061994521.1 putative disease resistance protein At4g19050 isoform X2 [Rosa rugosa]XP_061994522.1 putative disease resistance protein At4g19050 isoform X2 [Rosa rugosa]XP_061994523.1 putative disease resistance protein At4g19050 isoform X2 [Rosa rugosa]XP_061994524.1 putative disease resistance protein At4g19050 isoform X2 [Rosa rugosa]XP_061994525.1 putative disease resistance protein At4g19050 isoform X2 [Rosa rugosa]
MECLTAIGTGIIGKIAEFTVAPVGRQVGYVFHYNRNLSKLQNQVADLEAARESLEHKIVEEERAGRIVLETFVTNWLTDVNRIIGVAKDFLKDEHQAKIKCMHGFCPNLMARHHLSRKSTKLVQDVSYLYGKKDFSNIAYDVTPEDVCVFSTKDYQAFDSRTSVAKQIMDELRSSSTAMIGVYGIGGVGKTTLVKEVYRQATNDKTLFDDVVMVLDVNKHNPSIKRIQSEIAEKLGLKFHEIGTPAGRARHLCNRIKDKKTLVILDDVWENIDLETVGLPHLATLRILLTSRSKIVLSSNMGTQKVFHLQVLDREESWSLFQQMVGDIVNKPDIEIVAPQVAEKCGGLPLLIVTVARALKDSPLYAWKDTLRRLERLDGQGLTKKTYSAIQWSYDKLDNDELKLVFLLCAAVVGSSNTVDFLDLLKYSMGLGYIKNVDAMDEARDALRSLLGKLKDFCLLLDCGHSQHVSMHDLVKDVAKRIAAGRDQHMFSLSHGSELKEWPDKDFCSKCTIICLKKCKIPKLPEVLQCQELTMFHLDSTTDDSSRAIPCNFFEEMKKLRVLDLTGLSIPSLPPSIQFLKSLRTLCLDQCTLGDVTMIGQLQNLEILSFLMSKFKELPKDIGQLTRLRLLDLTDCSQLEVISPNVLSSLKRLEHLRMRNSFNRWEAVGVMTPERSNANLEELKHLPHLTELQLHIPNANILPPDLFTGSKLERFQICIGSVWKWDDVDEAINALKVQLTASNQFDQGLKMLLKRTEDLYLEGMEGVYRSIVYQLGAEGFHKLKHLHVQNNVEFINFIINGKVRYPNLTWLAVNELNGLRFLLSTSMARSLAQLKHLQVSGCQTMEEIVSVQESDEEIVHNLFGQLQDLELKDLPNLTKFCSRNYTELSNPSSGKLQLVDCNKTNTTFEEIEETDSTRNLDIVIQHFLFDNKGEFTNLKKLSIHGLAKLTRIWNNQLALESSKNLETIEIVSCDSLKSIFPGLMARSLQQLRSLRVQNCGVEEIVSKEDGVQTTPMFVFSKLTQVRFESLPQLRNFYPGLHSSKWPSLVALEVYDCIKVHIFAEGRRELNNLCTPNKQSLFLLEKDSFPNLEMLGMAVMENWDSPPLHLFRKLEFLCISARTDSSLNSLEKLLGLEKVKGEIHAVGDGTLPHLRVLHLHGMRKLMNLGEDSFGPACPYFPNLEILELEDCDSLKTLRSSAISFENLTTLQVSRCKGLKYLISFSMAKILMQLTKLEVQDCEEMIEIVGSNENDDSENEIEFRVLKHLELSALPSLRGFCSATRIAKFPSLEKLSMSCTQLETFIFDSMGKNNTIGKDIKDTDSSENHETEVVQHFLFDNKVEFPRLKSLFLKDLTKLTTIWHGQLSLNSFSSLKDLEVHECGNLINIFVSSTVGRLNALETLLIEECKSVQVVFELGGIDVIEEQDTSAVTRSKPFDCRNLKSVEINSCESLKNIFPASVARNLQQLQRLSLRGCGVEEIIAYEGEAQTTPKFVFSKVTFVCFGELSQLRSFYPAMHASNWPALQKLVVVRCHKLEIFSGALSSFQGKYESNPSTPIKQTLFSIEKDSFPNLEDLTLCSMEIWNGPLPVHFFRKLKSLTVCCPQSKSVVFLDKLLDEGSSSTRQREDAVEIGTLPRLKKLHLRLMPNLMHLGEDNSQSAPRPNFPNLEILLLSACASLQNLTSSAISFKNLTTLDVRLCKGLKYLLTYSVAKGLVQLTKLEIKDCRRLVSIVGSTEEDDSGNSDEIIFRRLKHLKLSILPRLQGFCSGNCIAKFPSLETSSMSNRLKLKIFPPHDQTLQLSELTNEEEDTDVDLWEWLLPIDDEMSSASTD